MFALETFGRFVATMAQWLMSIFLLKIAISSKIPFPKSSVPDKVINSGKYKGNFYNASYSRKSSSTFASILKGDAQKHSPPEQTKPDLVLDDLCIKERDFSKSLMGQVKEVSAIPNLYIVLLKEGLYYVNITYLGGLWVLFEFEALNSMDNFVIMWVLGHGS
ncbi:hypothetical protein Tco_0020566 [Tanacetum coccineum]